LRYGPDYRRNFLNGGRRRNRSHKRRSGFRAWRRRLWGWGLKRRSLRRRGYGNFRGHRFRQNRSQGLFRRGRRFYHHLDKIKGGFFRLRYFAILFFGGFGGQGRYGAFIRLFFYSFRSFRSRSFPFRNFRFPEGIFNKGLFGGQGTFCGTFAGKDQKPGHQQE
jgi:hypothetical protein